MAWEERVGTAVIDLQVRGDVNAALQRQRQEIEKITAQSVKAGQALRFDPGGQATADLARLREQVGRAGAALAYRQTPQGAAQLAEQQRLQRELAGLNAALNWSKESVVSFGASLRSGATLLGGMAAAVGYGVSQASPTHWKYLADSMNYLAAEFGTAFLPAITDLARAFQEFAFWMKQARELKEEVQLPEEKETRRFGIAFVGGMVRQELGAALLLSRGQAGQAAVMGAPWTAFGAAVERGKKATGEPELPPVAPGGKPLAEYTTGERYAEQLQVAGLAVGGAEDPQTKLLRLQLENLQQANGFIQSVDKNTAATARYLEGQQAWR